MKTFSSDTGIRVHILALEPGEYVLESIMKLIETEGIRTGAVVSGIGTLDYCIMHMGQRVGNIIQTWEDTPLELVGMQGVIADGKTHIHAVVSDKQSAVSGHPHEGCRVMWVCEIVIHEYVGFDLERTPIPNIRNKEILSEKGCAA